MNRRKWWLICLAGVLLATTIGVLTQRPGLKPEEEKSIFLMDESYKGVPEPSATESFR